MGKLVKDQLVKDTLPCLSPGGMTVVAPHDPRAPAADWHPGSFAPLPGPCWLIQNGSSYLSHVSQSIYQVLLRCHSLHKRFGHQRLLEINGVHTP